MLPTDIPSGSLLGPRPTKQKKWVGGYQIWLFCRFREFSFFFFYNSLINHPWVQRTVGLVVQESHLAPVGARHGGSTRCTSLVNQCNYCPESLGDVVAAAAFWDSAGPAERVTAGAQKLVQTPERGFYNSIFIACFMALSDETIKSTFNMAKNRNSVL